MVRKIVCLGLLFGLFGGLTPFAKPCMAADSQPVVVVSLSGVNAIFKDVNKLAAIGGVGAEAAPLAMIAAQAPAFGIDPAKPWGSALFLEGGLPQSLTFVPVSDAQQLMNMAKAFQAPLEDNMDGTYSVKSPNGPTLTLKEQGGWLYIAPPGTSLEKLPPDPSVWLGSLPKEYAFALQAIPQNVSPEIRKFVLDAIKQGADAALKQLPNEDDEQFKARQAAVEAHLAEFRDSLSDLDRLTIGWFVDDTGKKTGLDFKTTVKPGSNLSKVFAKDKTLHSDFSDFLRPAALNLHFSLNLEESDSASLLQLLAAIRQQAMQSLEDKQDAPEQSKGIKEPVGKILDVIGATIKSGRLNGGIMSDAIVGHTSMIAGGYVADGKALETAFKDLIEVGRKASPTVPAVSYDQEAYKGVRFHTMSVSFTDGSTNNIVYGPKLNLAAGFGDKQVYLAAGEDPIKAIKTSIDNSAAGANRNVLPLELSLAARPFIEINSAVVRDQAASNAKWIAALPKSIDKGRVRFLLQPVENGASARFEFDEGILQFFGAAIKEGMAQAQRRPAPPMQFEKKAVPD